MTVILISTVTILIALMIQHAPTVVMMSVIPVKTSAVAAMIVDYHQPQKQIVQMRLMKTAMDIQIVTTPIAAVIQPVRNVKGSKRPVPATTSAVVENAEEEPAGNDLNCNGPDEI